MTDKKARLLEVARRAGVGIATVDRVMNERGGVSQKTMDKVLRAAKEVNLKRILPTSHQRIIRIEVILARPELPLIERMITEFRLLLARTQHYGRPLIIQRRVLKDESASTIANALRDTKCDSVIVYSQEHELVDQAIQELMARGVPVVTLISDLPASRRLAYAGTDHVQAGRTAAYFMASMVKETGPVVVLCNHLGFQCHLERLEGFKDGLAQYGPHLHVAEIVEGHDDRVLSRTRLCLAFRQHHETLGVYNVGAANLAVIGAIHQRILEKQPVFIGHELTANTRVMLSEGDMAMAIDQNPEQQVLYAVDVLMHHFGFEGMEFMETPYRSTVPFTLYGPANI
jgi:LacI family transcriptional regulator